MPVDNATEAKLLHHAMATQNLTFSDLLALDPTLLGENDYKSVRNRWLFIKRIKTHNPERFSRMLAQATPGFQGILEAVHAARFDRERLVVTVDGSHARVEVPNNNETGAAFYPYNVTGAANRDILVSADGTIHLAASNDETAAANGDEESFVLID